MYSFLNDEEFIEKRKNGQYHLFKNLPFSVPSWEDLSIEFTRCISERNQVKIFDNFGFAIHTAENIKFVREVMTEFSKIEPNGIPSAHCYISFLPISKSFEEHTDDCDVLYWQCAGEIEWSVSGDKYVLSPNDAVFVPKNMRHYAVPLTARFGISFGVEK